MTNHVQLFKVRQGPTQIDQLHMTSY